MIHAVRAAVLEAGRAIERVRAAGFGVQQKGTDGPVTEADRSADGILKERLLAVAGGGWLSEETVDRPDRLEQDRLWIVDPLDGTREFVEGVPEYAVSVALVEEGRPVLAVVHNPARDDTFWATRGGGTFRNGEPARVRDGHRLLMSRSEGRRGELEPFAAEWELEAVGSIAWKLALVAAGEGAVTLSRGPKHEWDVCAGALLVSEAGGAATDLFGGALRYNQPWPKVRGILAGERAACERVAAKIRVVGASERMAEME